VKLRFVAEEILAETGAAAVDDDVSPADPAVG
jgi:hypothetical protein